MSSIGLYFTLRLFQILSEKKEAGLRMSPGLGQRQQHKRVLQLSWLERHTDNVEVGSSSLPGTTSLNFELRISNYKLSITNQ